MAAIAVKDANGNTVYILAAAGDGVAAASGFAYAVGGAVAAGAAVGGNPVLCGGSDGTNARTLATDTAGVQKVGPIPPGTALFDAHTAAATINTCTLTGAAATKVYLSGFSVTGLGATAAASIQITTTGLAGANQGVWTLPIPAGATVGVAPLNVTFNPPVPALAVNTPVTVVVPSFGGGNTVASASAWGFHV